MLLDFAVYCHRPFTLLDIGFDEMMDDD